MPASTAQPLRWPAEAIWEAVVPLLPGFTVEVLPSIDSSNTELMRRVRAGDAAPSLLVAEWQTAGRGRLGRNWHGSRGDSLMFSLSLPLAPADWSGLSLAVGLSLAESLHPEVRLKWPNDLWWRDRKLAGILIETAAVAEQRQVVIGVGINIAPREGAGLSTPPAWLQELEPGIDAPQALQRVMLPLVQTVLAFERDGFAPLRGRFAQRDALAGRPVRARSEAGPEVSGMAAGVAADGALLVHTAAGEVRVSSSEVSVRPVSPTSE